MNRTVISILVILLGAATPVTAETRFGCTDCLAEYDPSCDTGGGEGGKLSTEGLFGRRELNIFEQRELNKKKLEKELRSQERQFIVPPPPNIESSPWQMAKQDFIDWIGSNLYEETLGRVDSGLKSTVEKFEKLRKSITDFTVKVELLWYKGAEPGVRALGNPEDRGEHADKYWNDTFGKGGEAEKLKQEAGKMAEDEIKEQLKSMESTAPHGEGTD
jgi:hypothetical protein